MKSSTFPSAKLLRSLASVLGAAGGARRLVQAFGQSRMRVDGRSQLAYGQPGGQRRPGLGH
ncbi:MAG: hypothetical protein IJ678_04195, partial [Kiritimatiellae bacterium]|nr:hypothetical protein [Kiritimatiellia bacterium]